MYTILQQNNSFQGQQTTSTKDRDHIIHAIISQHKVHQSKNKARLEENRIFYHWIYTEAYLEILYTRHTSFNLAKLLI